MELVGYEDVEARSHEALASLVVHDGDFSISKDDIESMKKFKNDIDNILASNVEVDIHKLKPNDVFDKGLSTDFLMALYPIITE